MRDLYLVALVLLAGLAGTAVQTGSTKDPAQSKPGTTLALSAQSSQEPEGPLSILCATVTGDKCNPLPEFPDESFHVVIAFVPDPERTNLRLYFDRSMEAIANAAQDSGYTLFRYSLPWRTTAPHPYGTFADDNAAQAQRKERNSYPGILAFRNTSGGPALAVLLVGESPTEGYRVSQLEHALSFEPQLARAGDQLLLMGPCFSGTLAQLGRAIETQKAFKTRKVKVYSGTASAGDAWKKFNRRLGEHQRGVQSAAFLRTNEITMWAVTDFLEKNLGWSQDLASLSEEGTVFGDNFRTANKAAIEFRFPRGLSHVRQAYQNDPSFNKSTTEDPTNQDRLNLSLNGDPQAGRDQIPEFASDTPASHGAELGVMSDALQRGQLQYAAVVATDTLDLLFVASYLRTAAPDLRLILLDADLLQTIPSTDASLQGSLVVGPYPIYGESQSWIGRDRVRVFSSQFDEGLYGATAALLAVHSGPNQTPLSLLRGDVAHPADSGREQAVFWISAIGKDALWPIALRFRPDPEMLPGAEMLLPFHPTPPPRYWLTLAVALLIGVVGLFVAYFAAWFRGDSPSQWCADFSLHSSRGNVAGRAYYLSGLVLSVAGVWISITGCQFGFFLDSPVLNYPRVVIPAFWLIALTCFAVWLSWRALQEFWKDPEMKFSVKYLVLFLLPWINFGSYALALWSSLKQRPTKEGFFFSLRALDLGSGVCPALPFLFLSLAFVLLSWTQLQRVVFAEERSCLPPDLRNGPILALQNLVHTLNEALRKTLLDQPMMSLAASVAAFLFTYLFGLRSLRSLEGQAYDHAFALSVSILCFGLVLVVLRFWNTWRSLEALLEQLELHSIRDAFGNLPEGCSWSPIWQQSPRKRNYQLLSHSIESLEDISKLPGAPALGLDKIRIHARLLLRREAQGLREKLATYKDLQHGLSTAANALASALPRVSRSQVEIYFALRFLSYIRYVMLHLRNLATFVTFGYVLLALALGSYPFLAPRAIAWFLSLLLIGLSIPVVMGFREMSRNTILSKLTGAAAEGKSDWGFTTRTVSFAALPLLSMMASHFPFVGRYVFSWLQPALKSLH